MHPLRQQEWNLRAAEHRERAELWTQPFRQRRSRGQLHPVYDFLFIYYQFAPSQLEAWHPGPAQALISEQYLTPYTDKFYTLSGHVLQIDLGKMRPGARQRLEACLQLNQAIQSRPPQFGCFGLHEWAMVYGGGPEGRPRHEGRLPLRLPQSAIDAVVESRPLTCTHFDAFRFFTQQAQGFNKFQPGSDTRLKMEQCGCLHTNMDLYKWAFQAMPWIGSDLLWESFQFALRCRKLDMRASPYDCSSLGYAPIPIETEAGREAYEAKQRELSKTAATLREKLIAILKTLTLNA